jgi:hypothetical protein
MLSSTACRRRPRSLPASNHRQDDELHLVLASERRNISTGSVTNCTGLVGPLGAWFFVSPLHPEILRTCECGYTAHHVTSLYETKRRTSSQLPGLYRPGRLRLATLNQDNFTFVLVNSSILSTWSLDPVLYNDQSNMIARLYQYAGAWAHNSRWPRHLLGKPGVATMAARCSVLQQSMHPTDDRQIYATMGHSMRFNDPPIMDPCLFRGSVHPLHGETTGGGDVNIKVLGTMYIRTMRVPW